MKKIYLITSILIISLFPNQLLAQIKLTTKDLTGIWQYGTATLGEAIIQNFVFKDDGSFEFNNDQNNLISTFRLKGKYRLENKKIYFTITSKVVFENAKIGICDPILDFGIFEFKDGNVKEIIEEHPQEIHDPARFFIIDVKHIKINTEDYFKVSSNPDDLNKLR